MKKELSTPLMLGLIALAVLALGGIGFVLTKGEPAIKEQPKTANYTQEMPDYIKNRQNPGAPSGAAATGQAGRGEIPKSSTGTLPPGLPADMQGK